jgi:hypothetical protein
MSHWANSDPLVRRLGYGASRMRFNQALIAAAKTSFAVPLILLILTLAQRIFFLGQPISSGPLVFLEMPAWTLWMTAASLLIPITAGAWAYLKSKHGLLSAAISADKRLGLRARISSALTSSDASLRSPMTCCLLADARGYMQQIKLKKDFPIDVPRRMFSLCGGALALALFLTIVIPQGDAFGRVNASDQKKPEKEDLSEVLEHIKNQLKVQLKRKARDVPRNPKHPSVKLDDELSRLVKDLKTAASRDEALTRLNKLKDKISGSRSRMAAMARMMKQMESIKRSGDKSQLPSAQAKSTAQKMTSGAFAAAAEELEKLRKNIKDKMAAGAGLSDGEKEQLKRDLERLAKMTDDWKELSDQLNKAAGKLGQDDGIEAMQKAIDGLDEIARLMKELGLDGMGANKGANGLKGQCQQMQLTQEMIDRIKQMLRNARKCPQCQKLCCLKCGQAKCGCPGEPQCQCKPGDCSGSMGIPVPVPGAGAGSGQGAGGDGSQGSGSGGSGGDGSKSDGGMGGYGQGQGGIAPEKAHDVGMVSTQIKGKLGQGKIISHMFDRGRPTITDSEKKVQYHKATVAAAKAASEEIDSARIPRDLRDYVREYFTTDNKD